jgi:hypothetical protein
LLPICFSRFIFSSKKQTEFEASLAQLQKAHDETNLALQKSERDRQEAAATSAADLQVCFILSVFVNF